MFDLVISLFLLYCDESLAYSNNTESKSGLQSKDMTAGDTKKKQTKKHGELSVKLWEKILQHKSIFNLNWNSLRDIFRQVLIRWATVFKSQTLPEVQDGPESN